MQRGDAPIGGVLQGQQRVNAILNMVTDRADEIEADNNQEVDDLRRNVFQQAAPPIDGNFQRNMDNGDGNFLGQGVRQRVIDTDLKAPEKKYVDGGNFQGQGENGNFQGLGDGNFRGQDAGGIGPNGNDGNFQDQGMAGNRNFQGQNIDGNFRELGQAHEQPFNQPNINFGQKENNLQPGKERNDIMAPRGQHGQINDRQVHLFSIWWWTT